MRSDTTVAKKAARSTPSGGADSIASEVDVPWAIALLSEGRAAVRRPGGRVTVVERGPDAIEPPRADAALEVAIDHSSSAHKSPNSKTCGVVNRRT